MFAVFVPVFILVCAIAIDVGYWWVNAKKAQIAADACALAAAGDPAFPPPTDGRYVLDDDGEHYVLNHCRFGLPERDYVRTNLHLQSDPQKSILHESTTVKTPYKGDEDRVEAIVEIKVNTFFGTYVGVDSVDIVRRAVAEISTGLNEVAIHAHDANCDNDALVMNGEDMDIVGIVESNGFFEVNGKRITTGPASAGGPVECEHKVEGEDISFGGADEPTYDPVPHPWPVYFVPGEHPFDWPNSCDVVGTNIIFDTENEVIPDGVYCAHESFEVKAKGISGKITVFAPRISVNDPNTRFEPSTRAMNAGKPLLFMHIPNDSATAADDGPGDGLVCVHRNKMELNAENIIWTGIIFNPCDHININGAKNAALEGMIVAQTVRINGEDFSVKKISVAGTNKKLALWE